MKVCPHCDTTYPDAVAFCPQDGAGLQQQGEWSEGCVVRGKYRILSKVGEGGMGAVYKALHVAFNELRALKVIRPGLVRDEVFVKRFRQEAVFARRLQHPNAVRVDDIDEADDGRPLIVMEFIEGENLKGLIGAEGPLPVERVCSVAKQVASALQAAHAMGMIHRDIKPANIVLVPSPEGEQAKVLDFGIAKIKEARAQETSLNTLTGTGMVIGTPQYMSPEQALGKRGDDLDGRSDLYSLGIVMYQMLTGEVPFKGETTMQVLFAQVHTPAKPIREVRPDLQVPGCIERVVMKCLEKDRDLRPNDAGTLIEEIAQAEAEAARARTGFEPLPQATPETEQTARLPAETGRLVKERAERENLVRQQREESRRRIFDPQITETHSVTGGERPDGKRLQEERQSAEQSRQSRLTPQQFERIFGKQEEAKPELPRPVRREADRLSGLGVSPERPADQQTRKPQIQNTVVSGPVAPTGSRKTAALLTAAVIILLGAGAWYFYQSQHQELSQQPSSSTSVNPTSPPQPSQPEGPAPASTSPQSSVPPNTTAATVANPSTETTPPQSSPKSETLTTATVTNQLRIATIIRTGDRFLHKQNYARAIRAYQSGLKLDPANSELLAKLKQARIEAKAPRAEPVAGESHPAPAPQAPAARLAETSAPTTIPAQPAVPSTGALRVSAPAGAAIYIDGDSAGKVAANGSLLVSHLSPGNHQVRLALSGYQIWNGSINVQPGQTTSSAITLAAVPQPQVVSFHVTHQHTFGSCSGTLTIGNGRMSYDASKKSHSFDVPLTSIAKFGTVRYGADFYFELKNGRDYLFSGPMAALQAFERAREAAGPSLGSKVGQPSK